MVREGRVEGMNKSYKFESRDIVLQDVESNSPKVPFTIEQPAADINVRVSPPFAAKLTKETRATRTMMWLWTGEVSADGQGYRVLATGQKGVMRPLAGIAKNFPARDAPAPVRNERQRQGVRDRPGIRTQSVMPLILAVDTTSEYGSLALLRDGELLEEALLHAPDSFSPVLYDELRGLLERHGVETGGRDCFAAASGPGTFTGVRVALACVKGLAEAMGRPAVAVSNLQAVARYGTGAAARRGIGCAPRRNLRGGLR